MSVIVDWVRERFTRVRPLPAETLHVQSAPDEPAYRLHLRLNKDGSGILIVNAATVLHFNPTAAEYAYHMMKGTPSELKAAATGRSEEVAAPGPPAASPAMRATITCAPYPSSSRGTRSGRGPSSDSTWSSLRQKRATRS